MNLPWAILTLLSKDWLHPTLRLRQRYGFSISRLRALGWSSSLEETSSNINLELCSVSSCDSSRLEIKSIFKLVWVNLYAMWQKRRRLFLENKIQLVRSISRPFNMDPVCQFVSWLCYYESLHHSQGFESWKFEQSRNFGSVWKKDIK